MSLNQKCPLRDAGQYDFYEPAQLKLKERTCRTCKATVRTHSDASFVEWHRLTKAVHA